MTVTDQERATILAALLYWREEMTPHDPAIMRPYFEDLQLQQFVPLSADEISALIARLTAGLSPP